MSYVIIPLVSLMIGAAAGVACGLNDRRKFSKRVAR